MSETTKTNQIAFKGTRQYRQWLKGAANQRDITVQDLLEQAVSNYLAEPEAVSSGKRRGAHRPESQEPSYTDDERALIGALLRFLRDPQVSAPLRAILDNVLAEWKEPQNRKRNDRPA